jgi:hypothetical protein
MTPLKFTSDAEWLRELSLLEVPFGSAGQPREIREKAERFDEIAMKLEALLAMQKDYNTALGKLEQSLDINAKLVEENVQEHRLVESLQSRLDAIRAAFRKANGTLDWCDGTLDYQPMNSALWLDLEDAVFGAPENWPKDAETCHHVQVIAGSGDAAWSCSKCGATGTYTPKSGVVENHVHNYGDDGRCSCGIHALD